MSLPKSHLAYRDCYDAFDKAMADSVGIRLRQPDMDAANHLRQRMNYARLIDRRRNTATYGDDHPMSGVSQYDALVCRVKRDPEGHIWLYLEQRADIATDAEPLSEVIDGDFEVVKNTLPEGPVVPLIEFVKRRV